jgi:hypothetical protein
MSDIDKGMQERFEECICSECKRCSGEDRLQNLQIQSKLGLVTMSCSVPKEVQETKEQTA